MLLTGAYWRLLVLTDATARAPLSEPLTRVILYVILCEQQADQVELVGDCSGSEYPLQKKRHTLVSIMQLNFKSVLQL